ncbi:hypothetical protein FQZ97_1203490 [compost metagenome]
MPPVADGGAPQAGHAVEDLVAFAVPHVHAFTLDDDARANLAQLLIVAERSQVVVTAHGLPLAGLRIACLLGHIHLKNVRHQRVPRASRPGTRSLKPRAGGTHAPRN